jgi:tRNA (adenine57-N1/adenine58-N1)-methyltransferase
MTMTETPISDISVHKGTTFLQHKDIIEEGDTVIIYVNHTSQLPTVVKRGVTLNMKYGALRHEFLIGKPYGTPISATAGYIYALRPNPALWTRALSRQTQILYTPDISLILVLLDVKPGAVICESGTGSGSLSHAIATAVAPTGHLYTHDIEEPRTRKVENELKVCRSRTLSLVCC